MSEFEVSRLDDPEPWDRQPAESQDDFLAFTAYRNLGPKRTLAQVARDLGVSAGSVSVLSADGNWVSRAAAWDFYQERIFQAEMAEYTREMARRHVELATDSLEALRAPVDALVRKLEQDPDVFMEAFDIKDLAKLMKLVQDSAKIMPSIMSAERLAAGQPTQISEHTENTNVNYGDAERIGEVLDVLRTTGVLTAVLGEGAAGEIVDAQVVEVDDDPTDDETDGVPLGAAS